MSDPDWPFTEPKAVAVFTVAAIIEGRLPILRVCHDEEDGAWQFLTGGPVDEQDIRVVSFEEVARIEPSLRELAALPRGWEAVRNSPGEKWVMKREE